MNILTRAVILMSSVTIIPATPINITYEEPVMEEEVKESSVKIYPVQNEMSNLVYDAGLDKEIPLVEELIIEEPTVIETEVQVPILDQNEMVMASAVIEAEAGNQDLYGKRLVADVILNRIDSPKFPNTLYEVVNEKGQFTVMRNGAYQKALGRISPESYQALTLEMSGKRLDYGILYFSRGKTRGAKNHFKYQDHWFGY